MQSYFLGVLFLGEAVKSQSTLGCKCLRGSAWSLLLGPSILKEDLSHQSSDQRAGGCGNMSGRERALPGARALPWEVPCRC